MRQEASNILVADGKTDSFSQKVCFQLKVCLLVKASELLCIKKFGSCLALNTQCSVKYPASLGRGQRRQQTELTHRHQKQSAHWVQQLIIFL